MPSKKAIERARKDKQEGKAPSTQAGEFVREQVSRYEEGEGPAKSRKQAIAIGLSEARRSGVDLPPPRSGSGELKRRAERDLEKGDEEGEV